MQWVKISGKQLQAKDGPLKWIWQNSINILDPKATMNHYILENTILYGIRRILWQKNNRWLPIEKKRKFAL